MKKRFKSLSINTKLTWLFLGSMVLVLVLSSGAFVWNHVSTTERAIQHQLTPLASIIENQAKAALIFTETRTINEDLVSLSSLPSLEAAIVYDADGNVFASIPPVESDRSDQLKKYITIAHKNFETVASEDSIFTLEGKSHYLKSITLDRKTLGFVHLIDDRSAIREVLSRTFTSSLAIFALSIVTAILLAALLPQLISDPIHDLARTMRQVSREKDYSERAHRKADDEIGELVDGFNTMLEEVQKRDSTLEAHSHELEKKVDIRTKELARAVKKANAANQAKTRFLANVSHEIRTPVSAIVGLAQLMGNTKLSNHQSRLLNQQEQAAEHLTRIIDDLLDVALIESGQTRLKNEVFSLRDFVSSLAAIMEPRIQNKNLKLVVSLQSGIPDSFIGDTKKIRQVLLNLLSNATKFTETGQIRLDVRAVDRGVEWFTFHFTVKDTGIGISADQLSTIFEPFNQLISIDGVNPEGLGLGLAISQDISQAMGGEIKAESQPGKGSSFTLRVRLKQSNPLSQVPDPKSLDAHHPQNITLLVVEDNPLVAQVEKGLIESLGYSVLLAETGADAIERLEQHSVDIVLMDVQLPGMNGYEVTKAIREQERHKNLPVIALTAHAIKGEKQRCIEAGMNGILTKPLVLEDLKTKLEQFLTNSHPREKSISGQSRSEDRYMSQQSHEQLAKQLQDLDRQMGHDGVRKIVSESLKHLPNEAQELQRAISKNDRSKTKKIAHGLIGATTLWGEGALAKRLRSLHNANDGDTHYFDTAKKVHVELRSLIHWLSDYMDQSDSLISTQEQAIDRPPK